MLKLELCFDFTAKPREKAHFFTIEKSELNNIW
jgi:hypothetical protein